jgi:hypothetical protein
MIRKQMYLDERQDAKLRRLARRWRCTQAEVVRKALDSLAEDDDPFVAALRQAGLLVERPDPPDLLSAEEAERLQAQLDEDLSGRGPLRLSEAVWESRR